MITWDLALYAWQYFKLVFKLFRVWGTSEDVATTDQRLQNHYPKEWKELEEIRGKYNASHTKTDGLH